MDAILALLAYFAVWIAVGIVEVAAMGPPEGLNPNQKLCLYVVEEVLDLLVVLWLVHLLARRWSLSYRALGLVPFLPVRDIGIAAMVAIAVVGVISPVADWSATSLGLEVTAHPDLEEFASLDRPISLAVVFMVAVFLAPISEELVFRGLLFSGLCSVLSKTWAVVVGSLVFASVHIEPSLMLYSLLAGIFFFGVRARSGSLWPVLMSHAAVNFAGVIGHAIG